jgi:hypothetical protein
MNILIRDTEDALTYAENHKNWYINVIDLQILIPVRLSTQDLGKKYANNFEV